MHNIGNNKENWTNTVSQMAKLLIKFQDQFSDPDKKSALMHYLNVCTSVFAALLVDRGGGSCVVVFKFRPVVYS